MDHFMTHDEWRTFNKDEKKFKSLANARYYCYCGHSVIINKNEIRTFCTHCGHWVYKDKRKQRKNIELIKKEEFRNKVRGVINGNKSSIKRS